MDRNDDETATRIDWLVVGGPVRRWTDLGMSVLDGGDLPLPGTGIRVTDGGEPGLRGWVVSGADASISEIDGVPTIHAPIGRAAPAESAAGPASPVELVEQVGQVGLQATGHPLGVRAIDHVVVNTDDLERTCGAIADALGAPLKRVRDLGRARQGFHRVGRRRDNGLIVEVVERPDAPAGRASLWGFVLIVDDIDAACRLLGPDLVGDPKDAVQPGRRIATVRDSAGLGLPLAFMTPDA